MRVVSRPRTLPTSVVRVVSRPRTLPTEGLPRFNQATREVSSPEFLALSTLEELDVGSIGKVPRIHGAGAPGELLVVAHYFLKTTLAA